MQGLGRTPLFEEHRRLQAKLVEFGGYSMPLHYVPGILKEHEAVRSAAGLFDVSHMGRYEVAGAGAVPFVQQLITNDLDRLEQGRLLYTPVCQESGGVLDDITVYKLPERVLCVVNAGNRARMWDWFTRWRDAWTGEPITLSDRSEALAQIALQGPKAQQFLQVAVETDLEQVGYYAFTSTRLHGVPECLISRNGYTGEDGFEIYLPAGEAAKIWRALCEANAGQGLLPTGLGCRDTLRMEMAYCLYGHELTLETNPLEARLQWTVKLKKPAFVGKEALEAAKAAGPKRSLIGFVVEGQRLARQDQSILHQGREVGVVTSGGFSPSLKRGIGLGYVSPTLTAPGAKLEVDVRGELVPVVVEDLPFYKHGSHR